MYINYGIFCEFDINGPNQNILLFLNTVTPLSIQRSTLSLTSVMLNYTNVMKTMFQCFRFVDRCSETMQSECSCANDFSLNKSTVDRTSHCLIHYLINSINSSCSLLHRKRVIVKALCC